MPFRDVSCIKYILVHVNNKKESLISVKWNDTRMYSILGNRMADKKLNNDEWKGIKIAYITISQCKLFTLQKVNWINASGKKSQTSEFSDIFIINWDRIESIQLLLMCFVSSAFANFIF